MGLRCTSNTPKIVRYQCSRWLPYPIVSAGLQKHCLPLADRIARNKNKQQDAIIPATPSLHRLSTSSLSCCPTSMTESTVPISHQNRGGASIRRGTSALIALHLWDFPPGLAVRRVNSGPKIGRRYFHEYFVTHLPSSSLHPDSRSPVGPHHKLPRSDSTPHTPGSGSSPAAPPPMAGPSREMTVVRIPLRSAKHHFGVSTARGTRPYNEDTYQAGVIEIPAFARKAPVSLTHSPTSGQGEGTSADSASGDPQVFYFGVFDGHGGAACSEFLRDQLHGYIEDSAGKFSLRSSLQRSSSESSRLARDAEANIEATKPEPAADDFASTSSAQRIRDIEESLMKQWRDTVGGYFKRFRPEYFSAPGPSKHSERPHPAAKPGELGAGSGSTGVEAMMTYAFLKADLDFVSDQARKDEEDLVQADRALNDGDILGEASKARYPPMRPRSFRGGSTCSVAVVSTPTPTPFWHPATPSTLITAHVGDTRILLCSTSSGSSVPLTTNHHPSSPVEGARLRRYAATFITDSFGEERMTGLANTRAFGDMQSKRIGVSAEPEIRRIEMKPAEYSFMVLVSDGISGTLSDQEIVDIVKEARTPDQGARDVVSFATEVSQEGDNATCLVIRLGGWERRSEGGLGAMGTLEGRNWRRQDAIDPRSRRT